MADGRDPKITIDLDSASLEADVNKVIALFGRLNAATDKMRAKMETPGTKAAGLKEMKNQLRQLDREIGTYAARISKNLKKIQEPLSGEMQKSFLAASDLLRKRQGKDAESLRNMRSYLRELKQLRDKGAKDNNINPYIDSLIKDQTKKLGAASVSMINDLNKQIVATRNKMTKSMADAEMKHLNESLNKLETRRRSAVDKLKRDSKEFGFKTNDLPGYDKLVDSNAERALNKTTTALKKQNDAIKQVEGAYKRLHSLQKQSMKLAAEEHTAPKADGETARRRRVVEDKIKAEEAFIERTAKKHGLNREKIDGYDKYRNLNYDRNMQRGLIEEARQRSKALGLVERQKRAYEELSAARMRYTSLVSRGEKISDKQMSTLVGDMERKSKAFTSASRDLNKAIRYMPSGIQDIAKESARTYYDKERVARKVAAADSASEHAKFHASIAGIASDTEKVGRLQQYVAQAVESTGRKRQAGIRYGQEELALAQRRAEAEGRVEAIVGNHVAKQQVLQKISQQQAKSLAMGFDDSHRSILQPRSLVAQKFINSGIYGASGMVQAGVYTQLRDGITAIKDYELGIIDLRRTMQNVTEGDLTKFGKTALKYSQDFGISIKEVQSAMTELARAGTGKGDLENMTKAVLAGVNTTEIGSAADVVSALVSTTKQLKMPMKETMGILDSWNMLSDRYAIHTDDFAKAIERSGSASKLLGLDLHKLNSVVTILGEATQASGEQIGTAFRAMGNRLLRPGTIKTLEGYGIAVKKNNKEFLSFEQIMDNVNAVVKDLPDNSIKLNEIMDALGGSWRKNWVTTLSNDWDRYRGLIEEQERDADGYSMRENEVAMDSLEKKAIKLKETFKRAFVETAENTGAKDNFKDFLDGLNDGLGSLIDNGKALNFVAKGLGSLDTAAGLWGSSKLFHMLTGVKLGMGTFKEFGNWLSGADNKYLKKFGNGITGLTGKMRTNEKVARELYRSHKEAGITDPERLAFLAQDMDRRLGTNIAGTAAFHDIESAKIKSQIEMKQTALKTLNEMQGKSHGAQLESVNNYIRQYEHELVGLNAQLDAHQKMARAAGEEVDGLGVYNERLADSTKKSTKATIESTDSMKRSSRGTKEYAIEAERAAKIRADQARAEQEIIRKQNRAIGRQALVGGLKSVGGFAAGMGIAMAVDTAINMLEKYIVTSKEAEQSTKRILTNHRNNMGEYHDAYKTMVKNNDDFKQTYGKSMSEAGRFVGAKGENIGLSAESYEAFKQQIESLRGTFPEVDKAITKSVETFGSYSHAVEAATGALGELKQKERRNFLFGNKEERKEREKSLKTLNDDWEGYVGKVSDYAVSKSSSAGIYDFKKGKADTLSNLIAPIYSDYKKARELQDKLKKIPGIDKGALGKVVKDQDTAKDFFRQLTTNADVLEKLSLSPGKTHKAFSDVIKGFRKDEDSLATLFTEAASTKGLRDDALLEQISTKFLYKNNEKIQELANKYGDDTSAMMDSLSGMMLKGKNGGYGVKDKDLEYAFTNMLKSPEYMDTLHKLVNTGQTPMEQVYSDVDKLATRLSQTTGMSRKNATKLIADQFGLMGTSAEEIAGEIESSMATVDKAFGKMKMTDVMPDFNKMTQQSIQQYSDFVNQLAAGTKDSAKPEVARQAVKNFLGSIKGICTDFTDFDFSSVTGLLKSKNGAEQIALLTENVKSVVGQFQQTDLAGAITQSIQGLGRNLQGINIGELLNSSVLQGLADAQLNGGDPSEAIKSALLTSINNSLARTGQEQITLDDLQGLDFSVDLKTGKVTVNDKDGDDGETKKKVEDAKKKKAEKTKQEAEEAGSEPEEIEVNQDINLRIKPKYGIKEEDTVFDDPTNPLGFETLTREGILFNKELPPIEMVQPLNKKYEVQEEGSAQEAVNEKTSEEVQNPEPKEVTQDVNVKTNVKKADDGESFIDKIKGIFSNLSENEAIETTQNVKVNAQVDLNSNGSEGLEGITNNIRSVLENMEPITVDLNQKIQFSPFSGESITGITQPIQAAFQSLQSEVSPILSSIQQETVSAGVNAQGVQTALTGAQSTISNMQSQINALKSSASGIANAINGAFNGIKGVNLNSLVASANSAKAALSGIKGVASGVGSSVSSSANRATSSLNRVAAAARRTGAALSSALNRHFKVSVTVPEIHMSGSIGPHGGSLIPTASYHTFARGGYIKGGRGGVYGLIGEAGHDEAIIPLDRGGIDKLGDAMKMALESKYATLPRPEFKDISAGNFSEKGIAPLIEEFFYQLNRDLSNFLNEFSIKTESLNNGYASSDFIKKIELDPRVKEIFDGFNTQFRFNVEKFDAKYQKDFLDLIQVPLKLLDKQENLLKQNIELSKYMGSKRRGSDLELQMIDLKVERIEAQNKAMNDMVLMLNKAKAGLKEMGYDASQMFDALGNPTWELNKALDELAKKASGAGKKGGKAADSAAEKAKNLVSAITDVTKAAEQAGDAISKIRLEMSKTLNDKAKKYVEDQIKQYEKGVKDLYEPQIRETERAKKAFDKSMQDQMKSLEKEHNSFERSINAQIKALQKRKKGLDDDEDRVERERKRLEDLDDKVRKAREKLENIKNNKDTQLYTRDENGNWQYEYTYDKDAYQKALEDLKKLEEDNNKEIKDQRKKASKEAIDAEIERLNDLKDARNDEYRDKREAMQEEKEMMSEYYAERLESLRAAQAGQMEIVKTMRASIDDIVRYVTTALQGMFGSVANAIKAVMHMDGEFKPAPYNPLVEYAPNAKLVNNLKGFGPTYNPKRLYDDYVRRYNEAMEKGEISHAMKVYDYYHSIGVTGEAPNFQRDFKVAPNKKAALDYAVKTSGTKTIDGFMEMQLGRIGTKGVKGNILTERDIANYLTAVGLPGDAIINARNQDFANKQNMYLNKVGAPGMDTSMFAKILGLPNNAFVPKKSIETQYAGIPEMIQKAGEKAGLSQKMIDSFYKSAYGMPISSELTRGMRPFLSSNGELITTTDKNTRILGQANSGVESATDALRKYGLIFDSSSGSIVSSNGSLQSTMSSLISAMKSYSHNGGNTPTPDYPNPDTGGSEPEPEPSPGGSDSGGSEPTPEEPKYGRDHPDFDKYVNHAKYIYNDIIRQGIKNEHVKYLESQGTDIPEYIAYTMLRDVEKYKKEKELHRLGFDSLIPYIPFEHGGIVPYTGLAMVHGSPHASEITFNARDAKKLYNMVHDVKELEVPSISIPNAPTASFMGRGSSSTETTTYNFQPGSLVFPNVENAAEIKEALVSLPRAVRRKAM